MEGYEDKYAAITSARDLITILYNRGALTSEEARSMSEDLDFEEARLDARRDAGELNSAVLTLDDEETETLARAAGVLHQHNVGSAAAKSALDQLFRIIGVLRQG